MRFAINRRFYILNAIFYLISLYLHLTMSIMIRSKGTEFAR